MNDTPEPPPPIRVRRDAPTPLVIVLLVIFAVLRIGQVVSLSHGAPTGKVRVSGGAERGMDTDSMQDLIQADLTAKTAYVSSLASHSPVVRPDKKWLNQALTAAAQLEQETENSPGAARRVILLRAVLGKPPLAVGGDGLDPLAAFTTALPADTPPDDRARYAAEARLWKTAFGGPLTPRQTDALTAQILALPGVRWWRYVALSSLYQSQGDLSEANRYALEARSHATPPLLSTGFVLLLRGALLLAGSLLLLYFMLRASGAFRATGPGDPGLDLWPTLPERQPFSERRLGAGDLMAVFVLYLVAREVIELIAAGFSGFGPSHLLAFSGLLSPFEGAIRRMPAMQRNTLSVVLEAIVYLLAAAPPFVFLWLLARQRGASLANELGWSRRALWPNIGYGVAGYALASPLMLLAALLAPRLFHHAPSPSNPVIPQIINTSGFWAVFVLIALASVAAPLVEELLFRGVFYNAAKLWLGVWPAIILTGLVFGFSHPVGIAEMLAIAVLGGVFAWMAETRKSLVPSITAHFVNNFTTTLLLIFVLSG